MDGPVPPDPEFPRLSSRPFPAYRYVPGRDPHPFSDPRGHSYGQAEPDCTGEAAALFRDWRSSPHFCYSVDLYNYAYWWEAHSGWEGLWRCLEPDEPRRFALQAFIQVSAAHLQRFLGRAAGVEMLLKHARLHLDAARSGGAALLGCDLEAWWRDAVAPYFAEQPGATYPFLRPA